MVSVPIPHLVIQKVFEKLVNLVCDDAIGRHDNCHELFVVVVMRVVGTKMEIFLFCRAFLTILTRTRVHKVTQFVRDAFL